MAAIESSLLNGAIVIMYYTRRYDIRLVRLWPVCGITYSCNLSIHLLAGGHFVLLLIVFCDGRTHYTV